mgnify:FL=1
MKKVMFGALALAAVLAVTGCSGKKQVVINSKADLEGKSIGVQAGTTGETYVQDEIKSAKCNSFKNVIDASLSLKNGAIDAIIVDELPAREVCKRNDDLKVLDIDLVTDVYAIAVKKGNAELLSSINKTISDMKADGRYESLINAFMPADGNVKIPAVEKASGNGTVRMGTNAAFFPFEYTEGSEVVGFDATMAQYIANDYGKNLEIQDMAFDGLIAALQSDAIDFIAAGMTATEERRQNVDFSEPYYESKQVVIVRK